MEAPRWVCEELRRLRSRARIGWQGFERTHPDQLNCGTFHLLEILPWRAIPYFLVEPWQDEFGPVYGGSWDRLVEVPCMRGAVSPEDVFSGRVVQIAKEWMKNPFQVEQDSRRALGERLETKFQDIVGNASDELSFNTRETGSGGYTAKKFVSPEDKKILAGDVEQKSFKDSMLLPE